MTRGTLGGAQADFTYDARNRLINAGNTSYIYDADNNRISVIDGVYETQYVVNPNAALSQVLIQTDDQGRQTFFVYGLGLIGQEDDNGTYLSYHFDYRGSTVALTDADGTVTDTFSYTAYGALESRTGATSTPFMYNGRDGVITDANGLYYMRARYYSPQLSRFINRDIIQGTIIDGQSLNRYAYVRGNPVSFVDPFGLSRDSGLWGMNSANKDMQILGITAALQWVIDNLNEIQEGLEYIGLVPVVGEYADGLNAVIYTARGDHFNAGLSMLAMNPFIGGVKVVGKLADKVDDGYDVIKGAGIAKNLSKLPVQAGEAGSYGDLAARAVRGDKLTPHHMPQAAAKFTPYSEGGSLVLPETEHFLTRTFGRKGSATLVEDAGLSFRKTLYKDIKDIRSISGSKYNSGLMDLLDYYKQNFPGLMKK